jgi:HEAT repeat protein
MQVRHAVHAFCCAITFSAGIVAQPVRTGTVAGVVANEWREPAHVTAQTPRVAPLDPQVIAVVDRVYPGFSEILELGDSISLARLARRLTANPSMESLTVLLWMLQTCPSWSTDEVPTVLQIAGVVRAIGRLPVAAFSDGLLNDDAAQRVNAAVVLSNGAAYVQPGELAIYERALTAALSDPNIHVREFAAGPLRQLHSPAGDAALARAIEGPDVTDILFWQATGRKRPFSGAAPAESSFPAETVAAVRAIAPDFVTTLTTREDAAVRRLIDAIERARDPAATPVLSWLLVHGDMRSYGDRIVFRLAEPPHAGRLQFAELSTALATSDPDHRLKIADLFGRVIRNAAVSPAPREQMIAALVGRLRDPDIDVRTRAAEALGPARAAAAEPELISMLADRETAVVPVVGALSAIDSRQALPALERLARSRAQGKRDSAVLAFLSLTKPADVGAEVRRISWEQPDTELERAVLVQGRAALPLAWQALATGSDRERRAAAALLGWFPDPNSIPPVLAALANSPGALTREQLLFDLNMILLMEGTPPDAAQRNDLAAAHLRWLYEQIASQPIDSDIRAAVLGRRAVAVFPDRIISPFSVDLSSRNWSATATRSESPQAFLTAVAGDGCGVAFHEITAAHGVARVATTLYLPRGRIANQTWISLYRRDADGWALLPVVSHPVLHRMLNEPNLLPTINRNYGADHPLKILRLNLTMERIRVDRNASRYLDNENLEDPRTSTRVDSSYARLFERYKRSDAPSVRYTAEYESARLTGEPNLQLWMNLLAERPASPFQDMAVNVIAPYAVEQIRREGREVTDNERDQLVAAALSPAAIEPRLLPQRRPAVENIRHVRRSSQFGLVDVGFGSGLLGQSGYSMLFERRGDRWVFVCVTGSWIS